MVVQRTPHRLVPAPRTCLPPTQRCRDRPSRPRCRTRPRRLGGIRVERRLSEKMLHCKGDHPDDHEHDKDCHGGFLDSARGGRDCRHGSSVVLAAARAAVPKGPTRGRLPQRWREPVVHHVNGEPQDARRARRTRTGKRGKRQFPLPPSRPGPLFRDRGPWCATLLLVRVAGVLNSASLVLNVPLGKPLLDAVLFTLGVAGDRIEHLTTAAPPAHPSSTGRRAQRQPPCAVRQCGLRRKALPVRDIRPAAPSSPHAKSVIHNAAALAGS